jgi:hypothetical protein
MLMLYKIGMPLAERLFISITLSRRYDQLRLLDGHVISLLYYSFLIVIIVYLRILPRQYPVTILKI